MKLITLLTGTFCCFSIFAQTRTQPQVSKPINATTIATPKTSTNESKSNEIIKNQPQVLELKKTNPVESLDIKPINTEVNNEVSAPKYSDPNYEKNLAKSKEQEERMKAPPTTKSAPLSKDKQMENYEMELKKYPENSYEYNQIIAKINILKSE